ncbi:MAG TPA: metallophosphoesterase family protein [Thermomicrobiales bacterium]|nr:metallophosphoesterase family protein [Thermomicrobiales bacterium]
MERIAIISDIHGNMTALRTVLAEIDDRGIQRIINLGDLAGKGPDGDQVVDICRERCEANVRGNWDEALATTTGRDWATPVQEQLGPERCAWLGSLPLAYDIPFARKRIRFVHASPQGVFHRVYQHGDDEPKLAMFDTTEHTDPDFVPDVVGYGDVHTAYIRTFRNRILFNVGSVGNPLDLTMAAFAVLESSGPTIGINIVRVPYDIEAELRRARESGMPAYDEYAWELTTARSRNDMPAAVAE